MIKSISSKNYADALSELATNSSLSFDEIREDLQKVETILQSSAELKSVLENVTISVDVKSEIIEEVFRNQVCAQIVNFLKILAEKGKFSQFAEVKAAFEECYNREKNIQFVTVTSAVELREDQRQRVVSKLQEKLNKTIQALWRVDESLIGGLVVKIDDNVINASLKNKLEKLI